MKPLYDPEEIISHTEMCAAEGMMLQHGMHYREDDSVFLMSRRASAPYADTYDERRNLIIYEGHDEPRTSGGPNPKLVDQPTHSKSRNAKFLTAAREYKEGVRTSPMTIRVYEKLKPGIWVYNGPFALEDVWMEMVGVRKVIKFGLRRKPLTLAGVVASPKVLEQTRVIPSAVKQEVFKRDGGKCVLCGSRHNLHFDHDLAYVLGGSSLTAQNIRLLCATHNLRKGAKLM